MAYFTEEQASNTTIISVVQNLEDGVTESVTVTIQQSNGHKQSFGLTGVDENTTQEQLIQAVKDKLTTSVEWVTLSTQNVLTQFSNITVS